MSLRKIILAAVSAAVCLCSACGQAQDKLGGELVKAAREKYAALDSAKVIMTNTETGEIEQTFTFKYDEKDVLMYSYYGKNGDVEYAQYNNGAECFTYDNGEYTHLVKGQSGFSQYTRELTHPQADEGLLIYDPENIISDEQTAQEDGTTVYTYVYDTEKIGASVDEGQVTGFSVQYCFDENDELMYFTEVTEAQADGEDKVYSYKVEITQQNSVDKVENTTEQFKTD